jgi:Holliday junction resolvase RusA-like endonuclease
MINFIVPGEPILVARGNSNGNFQAKPQRKRAYQTEIAILASNAMGGEPPLAGPIEVTLRVEYAIARAWPVNQEEAAVWKTTKNDTDKIIRLCIDAMNNIVFTDEAQVASLSMKKVYGPYARLFVSVRELSRGDRALADMLSIGKPTLGWRGCQESDD